jgi:8-oxo-dGTP pyrophosphatase MutT (NUDIX family)
MQTFIQQLQLQLLTKLPGFVAQSIMAPPSRGQVQAKPLDAKIGGVMVLLFLKNNEWHILLMQRTVDGGTHSGQISFAGGKYDAQDGCITYTAMRELQEEMSIHHTQYSILGQLTPLYIPPSNFYVTPIVAVVNQTLQVQPNPTEVSAVIQMPLTHLLNNANMQVATVYRSDDVSITMQAPVYRLDDNTIIWGATAMMLSELKQLVQTII